MRQWIIALAFSVLAAAPVAGQECPEGDDTCRTTQIGSGGRTQLGSGARVGTTECAEGDENCETGQSGSGGRTQLGSGARVGTTECPEGDENCETGQSGSGGRTQLGSGARAEGTSIRWSHILDRNDEWLRVATITFADGSCQLLIFRD